MIKKSTYQENWQKIRNVFIVAGLPWIILLISILLPDYGGNNTLYALIIIMLIWIVMAFVGLKNMFSYVGNTIKNAKDDQNVIKKIYTFRGKPIDKIN